MNIAESFTMNINSRLQKISKRPVRSLLALALVGSFLASTSPLANANSRVLAPMANSNAWFVNWHQGFEHNSAGWYDASTEGPLGWCGEIKTVSSRGRKEGAAPAPSAGKGYATVQVGGCNEFWPVPFGAPYAPGPEQALYSSAWPNSGYVTELDIYLDPEWSGDFQGGFEFAGSSPNALIQYAATIFPTMPDDDPFHTGPHYIVDVEAVPDEEVLTVAGERIEAAGWYTFRFVFDDVGGQVQVDFELAARKGPILVVEQNLAPVELIGPFKAPFVEELPTADYGSGHVWFRDIALGLKLPIDEHRVRRGR
jgi:hypothetical protein